MPKEYPINHMQLVQLIDAQYPYFEKLWTSGEENERFKRIENWTEAQKTRD